MSTPNHFAGRRLRAGIVGGGQGAFIGSVHRIAAELDGEARLVAGAMSSDPAVARKSAALWYLDRSYDSYAAMARQEPTLSDGIDFVIIAAPNHLHLPVATAFLDAGIHVVCEKPLALTVDEGAHLARRVADGTTLFALTHNYTGYPAVRQARDMIFGGDLGALRKVHVDYHQDWLMGAVERSGNKQAEWRTDPGRAGIGGCIGDIGTHAENLLTFLTGLNITSLCADLTAFVPGRRLDDDANLLLRLDGGVRGTLSCSQIACGEDNNLRVRIYGTKGGIEWQQQDPNRLLLKLPGADRRVLHTGSAAMGVAARGATRTPAGHPEGYLEAFANIYRDFIADIRRTRRGEVAVGGYPTVHDGLRGLRFVAKCVESSSGRPHPQWVEL